MLKLYLFGPPRVELEGAAVDIQRRKALALLVYLAVTGQPHSRDALATLLYPDLDQKRTRAYFRRNLSTLNSNLTGNWLAIDRETVGLQPTADIWVDATHFRASLAGCRQHNHAEETVCADCLPLLTAAAELYTDHFLAGFSLPDSPEFDDWQFFEAEGLRQALAIVLARLVQGYSNLDQPALAIPYARRWLALDPLHEPVHRELMQLYAQADQQAAALRQYEECVRILQEELGLPPEEETTTLYEAIKAKRIIEPLLRAQTPQPGGQKRSNNRIFNETSDLQPSPSLSTRPFAPVDQKIGFTYSADGTKIAYAVVGNGPPLVKVANPLTHLQYDWESPIWRHWIEELSRSHTLIRYDERGCGLSEREMTNFSVDDWVNDLEAVVDAVGLKQFPIFSTSQGTSIAIAYAFRHPEKISKLIFHNGYTRGRLHRDPTPEQIIECETLLNVIRIGWGQDTPAFRQVFATLFVPEGNPVQHRWFTELARITVDPDIAVAMERTFFDINVSHLAPIVAAPVLVTHSRGDVMVPFAEGRLMADLLPNARFVPLESNNHVLLADEPAWQDFLAEMHQFLADSPETPGSTTAGPSDSLTCPACGALYLATQQYCGQCGLLLP